MGITVSLLGTPKVVSNGQEITFPYRKVEGLFYYLCVKRSVSRDEVISIFWADSSENSARKNLRDGIYHLKKILGEDIVLTQGNNKLSLNPQRIDSIDLDHIMQDNILTTYTGEFLGYFYIKNCMEFEDWAGTIREELLHRYQKAVRRWVVSVSKQTSIQPMLDCVNHLLQRNVVEEELYRLLFKSLLEQGAVTQVQQLYQRLQSLLQDELGTEPEAETAALIAQSNSLYQKLNEFHKSEPAPDYFFGREKELYHLVSYLDRFRHNRPTPSVLLTGEAGVGKSTLMNRLSTLAESDPFFILSYQCVQTEQELYLKPWTDILHNALVLCNTNGIPNVPLPGLFSEQMDASLFATQYELCAQRIIQALSSDVEQKKVLLFIDDIQWMDPASLRLLANLLHWSKNETMMAVLTVRDDCAQNLRSWKSTLESKGLLAELAVPRFTKDETIEIIRQYHPAILGQPEQVEKIYHDTDGNALFLLEYLKQLAHTGSPEQRSLKTTGIIESRLSDLSIKERSLLERISLYPRFATLQELLVLSRLAPVELLEVLDGLLSRQLIFVNSTYNKTGYGFSHQLIREYVYNSMLEDKRQLLHQIVAQEYERQYKQTEDISLCPMLIYHFSRCKDTCKEYTYRLEYLRAFYAAKHEIYPTLLTSQNISDYHLPRSSSADQLISLAEKIRSLTGTPEQVDPLRMKMEFLIGRYDLYSGTYEKGLKNIYTSIALAEKLHDATYLLENHLQLVFHSIQIHDMKMYHDNITICHDLLQQYSYSQGEICTVTRLEGLYHMKNFQYDRAEELFTSVIDNMLPLCKLDTTYRIGLAACYNYLGEIRQSQSRLDEALSFYLQAIDCCGEEMVSGVGVFCSNAGYILLQQGKLDEAERYIDRANECFEKTDAMWGRSRARSYAALVAAQRGDLKKAFEHFEVAQLTARQGGNPSALLLVQEVAEVLKKYQQGIPQNEIK